MYKKTIYRERVVAGKRAYRFAVNENRAGKKYLVITEKRAAEFEAELQSVIVFEKDLELFHQVYLRAAGQFVQRPRAYSVEMVREECPKAYTKWTKEDDDELVIRFSRGAGVNKLAKVFQRTRGGILFRLLDLGLIPE
jgi:hypothetical protein